MNPQIEFSRICQEILTDQNRLKFQVAGGSMRPFMRTGDTIVVEPVEIAMINSGDIVFCKTSAGKLYVHRVIKKLDQGEQTVLVTKGDAYIHPDPLVEAKDVLGKVIAIERNGKHRNIDGSANYFWFRLAQLGPYFYPLAAIFKKLGDADDIYEKLLVNIPSEREENGPLIEKLSAPGFKWEYFLQRAIEEKVAPLIYKSLEAWGTARLNIPAVVLERFRSSYYQTLTNNVLIFKKTGEILAAFRRQGIKILVFKGPVLAELLYPDIGLRPITDVDILVAREDLPAADRILQELNYTAPFAIKDFSSLQANPYRNSLMYTDPQGTPRFVHLYWHLLNLFPFEQEVLGKFTMKNIWQSATTVYVDEVPALTLADTHQVIYLCLHAFQHAYTPGMLLYDLFKFLQLKGSSLDWDFLARESFSLGLDRYVYFGLELVYEVFGVPVPQECLVKLKPKKLSIFERRFLKGFIKHGFYGRQVNLGLVTMGMNEKWGKRLEFIWQAIFPNKQEMALISQQEVSKVGFADYARRALGEKSYRFILFINKIAARRINLLSAFQKMRSYRRLMGKIAGKDIIIRAAELADKKSLRSVYATMIVQEIEQLIIDLKKEGYCLIALKNKTITGALTIFKYEKDEKLWLIFGLETKPMFRGLGIARKLVQEAIVRATAAGAREVGLFVNKKAIPALNLYQQAGFRVSPAPYQRSADEIYLHYSCRIFD